MHTAVVSVEEEEALSQARAPGCHSSTCKFIDNGSEWTKFDPPEALSKLPNITSETIIAVVQSSLENVRRQIEAERQRPPKQQENSKDEVCAEGISPKADKGKQPAGDLTRRSEDVVPALPLSLKAGQARSHRRSRFGISRILRHVIRESENLQSDVVKAARRASGRSEDMFTTSTFTQHVYKRIESSATNTAIAETIECVSCFEEISPKNAVRTVCHAYCKDCFNRLIETSVENESQWPPKCCLNPIPFRTITKYTRSQLLKTYREKVYEFSVPAATRIYCSQPDCGAWVRREQMNRTNNTGKCPRGHHICLICRQLAHPSNKTCPQDRNQQLTDRLAEEEGWRRCYKCGVLVEHRAACHHMTCRCGADFCYVCGARWRTCECTVEQLVELKQKAQERHQSRTAAEEAEEAEFREALRLIEAFEAEEERKAAARAAEREARRLRREEARRVALDEKYSGLNQKLADLNDMQCVMLEYTHDREHEDASVRATTARDELATKTATERESLRAATAASIANGELEWERDFRSRVAWERALEAEYEARLARFWKGKAGGAKAGQAALRAYMRKNDARLDAWRQWKDGELERFRYTQNDELAIREELLDAAVPKLDELLRDQESERCERHAAEARWLELVTAERLRLMAEVETVEREMGGQSERGSQNGSSDDDEEGKA